MTAAAVVGEGKASRSLPFANGGSGEIKTQRRRISMITLSKLDGTYFALNPDLIETVIENPDTTIYLTNKKFYIVKENMEEVIEKVVEFRKEINGVFDRQ